MSNLFIILCLHALIGWVPAVACAHEVRAEMHTPFKSPPDGTTDIFNTQQLFDKQVTLEQLFVNLIHYFAAIAYNPSDSFERGKNIFNIVLNIIHFAFTHFYHRSSINDYGVHITPLVVSNISKLAMVYSPLFAQNGIHITIKSAIPVEANYGFNDSSIMNEFQQIEHCFFAIMHNPDNKEVIANNLEHLVDHCYQIALLVGNMQGVPDINAVTSATDIVLQ